MKKHYLYIVLLFLFTNCATYKAQYANSENAMDVLNTKEVSHTFYLIGDAGLSPMGELNLALELFQKKLKKATENSTTIFLGDNIYPAGMPAKKQDKLRYNIAKNNLDAQLKTLKDYKGKTIFIPGNHDWYTDGLDGLKREEKYITKKTHSKKVFFPKDGCPIKKIAITKDIVVIAIDTEWYLTNWDRHPNMNDDCDIKSRAKFFEELEGLIKKNSNKTTILAMHHPMFSYGTHGGQFSLKKQFYPGHNKIPLPILGTFINVLRRTSGASIEDLNNKKYRELKKRVVTLAQYSENVIFASGHEHTLQYIKENNTPQIVSGGGAKEGAARLINGSKFAYGGMGYATLEVYKDGSSRVRYFGLDQDKNEKFLFTTEVLNSKKKPAIKQYTDDFPSEVSASVYTEEEVTKSKFFTSFWGERYRKYYGIKVKAPTVRLDTLFGGLVPVRKGGGHQSKSLRLEAKDGKQYVMRALRKSAELYLQSMAFQDQYIMGDFEDTITESILMDFYTGDHPYAPFTIGALSDAVGVYHTNPVLYYVPKQAALGGFNTIFGDELYMIEEHTSDGHGDQKSFDFANKIISTDDLFKKLRKDESYLVDSDSYIRARLFDMVIGDWDRHVDQWRWAAFKNKETGKVVYRPIPRDRDQAFSIMGDGAFMKLATRLVPGLRTMEGFKETIRSVKGYNSSPKTYVLDMTLLNETTYEQWESQVSFIQENLTATVIDKAFKLFPEEVQDETILEMKKVLLARIKNLTTTADEYYKILNKFAVIIGTDKDDWFEINCLGEEETEVKGYRIIDGKKAKMFFNKKFSKDITKEIWIYGLDDKDYFEVNGEAKSAIKIRLVGGHDKDVYAINSGKNIFIYDNKSKKNIFKNTQGAKIKLTNDYETNTYLPYKLKNSVNQLVPTVGFNPDDGFKIGFSNNYTLNGFRQNPFTNRHIVNASYYFSTSGFELDYRGEFANVFDKWNLEILARVTSPNFSINFFGFGNETKNVDNLLGMDYNRVRVETLKFTPSLVWRGDLGAKFKAGISYENIEVEETNDRFINTFYLGNGQESSSSFFGADLEYTYENEDSEAFPTMGMATVIQMGYKRNLENSKHFSYIIPSLSFNYKLVPNGNLVVATKAKAHFNIGDGYEFYHGATIGASDGPRGYRNQRFTGKTSYYQNTDIRLNFKKMKTGLVPVSLGIYGGFDYGKVWMPGIDSDKWHTSYGGGFFLNTADVVALKIAYFSSGEDSLFSFGLGFGF